MPSVTRLDPKTIFTPEEWTTLSKHSQWKGPALIVFAWAVIIGAGALFIYAPNPLTYILAVMLIGARQLGLAILEHDAAHGALHPNAKLNDWMAEWLCGSAVGGSLKRYRPYHLTHHKYTEQQEDPDLGLSRPFPITRKSLNRKLLRDLTGQTFYKQRIKPFIARLKGEKRNPPRVPDTPGRRFWIVNGVIIVVTTALGYWWAWPVLWVVPMATWFPLVTRLRSMAEHAMVGTEDDPFTHARTTLANPIERLLIAPFWVHYHCEHHVFMYVPCYNLENTHKLLIKKGYGPRMRITKGYSEVLKRCASKIEDAMPPPPRPVERLAREPGMDF
ncbi:MAG TPA: fatty acid desaturase family protein [Hyphomonadaceae bacterium]|nr:fatty acid desaturase family protein [Hyphomonadaceae bacterium]